MMEPCPKCSGPPVAIETATAAQSIELIVVCGCGVRWTMSGLTVEDALAVADDALRQSAWTGSTHAARGLFLELANRTDDAYQTYATALRCSGKFDRAFCYERRAAYEAHRGWLRNALYSLQEAVLADKRASGARVKTYMEALAKLEPHVPADRTARARELELPPGIGAKNELGEPLTDDVIEIERLVRSERWDDVVAALKALPPNHLVDAIGFASRAVDLAPRAAAIAIQEVVVHAYVIWASWSTSGAEGLARTAEVDRERGRLRGLQTDW